MDVSNSRQTGHWRSMYSTSVAGAVALPRTFPCCGMPSNCFWIVAASGSRWALEFRTTGEEAQELLFDSDELTMTKEWLVGTCEGAEPCVTDDALQRIAKYHRALVRLSADDMR